MQKKIKLTYFVKFQPPIENRRRQAQAWCVCVQFEFAHRTPWKNIKIGFQQTSVADKLIESSDRIIIKVANR